MPTTFGGEPLKFYYLLFSLLI
ncbi:hypothetical protein [Staphylococcus aureus]